MIEPLLWRDGHVAFLDQTRLPQEEAWVETDDPAVIIGAIQELAIRGAPLIGIAGAYAAVLAAQRHVGRPWESVHPLWDVIERARPTAVNLSWAVRRMRNTVQPSGLVTRIDIDALIRAASAIHADEREACAKLAAAGAQLLPPNGAVLTHCNTGALATGGLGTALGVIRTAWKSGRCSHVYVDETRPLLQGARLTAWELRMIGVPYTLIPDAAAAVLMQRGVVQSVVVGADRIARNGDVANKVGSYGLAVLAKAHAIPFYVAAPVSTVDLATPDGSAIPIEQRSADEVRSVSGRRIAPADAQVFNPAFDVVPASLITAIISDRGVAQPPNAESVALLAGTGERA